MAQYDIRVPNQNSTAAEEPLEPFVMGFLWQQAMFNMGTTPVLAITGLVFSL